MSRANRVPLTPETIERLAPRGSEYTIWDTDTPNLGVRVRPSGTATYILIRKTIHGSRRISIASTAVITLDEARSQALLDRARTTTSTTPPSTGLPPLFADFVISDWWNDSTFDNLPRRQRQQRLILLANHVLPVFGSKALNAITPLELDSWFSSLLDDSPTLAQPALALLKNILSLARKRGHLVSDPTRFLYATHPPTAPNHRLRTLTRQIGNTLQTVLFPGAPAHPPANPTPPENVPSE